MDEAEKNESRRRLVSEEIASTDRSDENSDPNDRQAEGQCSINGDASGHAASSANEDTPSSEGCLTACFGKRLPEHRRLLLFNILLLIWSALTAGLIMLELHKAYGQCMLGMPLYAGGLDPRNVKSFWCKCPLYTILLATAVAWVSIMVNWVSDLHSKRAAFYKWLKWQGGLTLCALVGSLCSVGITVSGFIVWCGSIQVALRDDDEQNPRHVPKMCYMAAKEFDELHTDEFVKLYHTFFYSVGITIMISIHLALWIGANYYTLRLLHVEPKDNQNAGHYAFSTAPPHARHNPDAGRNVDPDRSTDPDRNADARHNTDTGRDVDEGHNTDANLSGNIAPQENNQNLLEDVHQEE